MEPHADKVKLFILCWVKYKMIDPFFKKGDPVLIVYKGQREWLSIVGKTLHTHVGVFDLNDLIGKPSGTVIHAQNGKRAVAYRPRLREWVTKFRHESQIIYPKDAGIIITYSDIKPGDVVLEAGTGSGALTAYLSRAVAENGKVITYEVREHAFEAAKRNLEKLGITNVEQRFRDIVEDGFDVDDNSADVIVLDMGEPWKVLKEAYRVLKPSGTLTVFIPTYNQIEATYLGMLEIGFEKIEALELLARPIQLKKNAIRPVTRMISHTGFLMFAQKIVKTLE